jgi:hypothetical protein
MLCANNGEETVTNFIVLGLTRSGFGPTLYCTQVEPTNHTVTPCSISILPGDV